MTDLIGICSSVFYLCQLLSIVLKEMHILSLNELQTLTKILIFSILLLGTETLMLFIFLFKKQNKNNGIQTKLLFFISVQARKTKSNTTLTWGLFSICSLTERYIKRAKISFQFTDLKSDIQKKQSFVLVFPSIQNQQRN